MPHGDRRTDVCGIKTDQPLVNQLLNDLAELRRLGSPSGGSDGLNKQARRADQLRLLEYTLNRMWLRARERRRRPEQATTCAAAR